MHEKQAESANTVDPFEERWAWKSGALAGLLATVAMGIVISIMDLETLRVAIAGLYAQEGSLIAGWVAHLIHGTLFGLLFAYILTDPGLAGITRWAWKTIFAGIIYGLVLTVIGAGIIMPIWLSAVGFTAPLSLPNVTGASLVWHFVYGAILGTLFAALESR